MEKSLFLPMFLDKSITPRAAPLWGHGCVVTWEWVGCTQTMEVSFAGKMIDLNGRYSLAIIDNSRDHWYLCNDSSTYMRLVWISSAELSEHQCEEHHPFLLRATGSLGHGLYHEPKLRQWIPLVLQPQTSEHKVPAGSSAAPGHATGETPPYVSLEIGPSLNQGISNKIVGVHCPQWRTRLLKQTPCHDSQGP